MTRHDDRAADSERIQSAGRERNAAQPLNAAEENAGAERYPPLRRDDGIDGAAAEARTVAGGNPRPRQGAGDGAPAPDAGKADER